MKRWVVIVAGVAAIAGVVYVFRPGAFHRASAFATPSPAPIGSKPVQASRAVDSESAPIGSSVATPAISVATLEAMPVELLVARLREAGLPDGVIRAIVTAHIGASWEARRREMDASRPSAPYWQKTPPDVLRGENYVEVYDTTKRNRQRVDELLGPAVPAGLDAIRLQAQYGDLPPAKIARMEEIDSDYNAMVARVRGPAGSALLPSDREKLAYLDTEKEKDIQRLLDAREYDSYTMRYSLSASALRKTLRSFEPTEAEFRALLVVQRAFDEKYGAPTSSDPAVMLARLEAQKVLKRDMAAALAENRRAEFEQATR